MGKIGVLMRFVLTIPTYSERSIRFYEQELGGSGSSWFGLYLKEWVGQCVVLGEQDRYGRNT
jgi:hypothetical protein